MEPLHLYISAGSWLLLLCLLQSCGTCRSGSAAEERCRRWGPAFRNQLCWPVPSSFCVLGVFADRFRVKFGGAEVPAGFLADFLSAALLGPLPGAVVAASVLLHADRRGGWQRTLFDSASLLHSGGRDRHRLLGNPGRLREIGIVIGHRGACGWAVRISCSTSSCTARSLVSGGVWARREWFDGGLRAVSCPFTCSSLRSVWV